MNGTLVIGISFVMIFQLSKAAASGVEAKSSVSPLKAFSPTLCRAYKINDSGKSSDSTQGGKSIEKLVVAQPWISAFRKVDNSERIEIKLANGKPLSFVSDRQGTGNTYWIEEIDCLNSFLTIGQNDSSGEGFRQKVFSLKNGNELLSSRLLAIQWSPRRDFAITYFTDSEYEGEDFRVFRRQGESFVVVWDGSKKYRLNEDDLPSSMKKSPRGAFVFRAKTKGEQITKKQDEDAHEAPIYLIQNYKVECPENTSEKCKVHFESKTEESWQPG